MKLLIVLLAACVPLSSSTMSTTAAPTATAQTTEAAAPAADTRWFVAAGSVATGPEPAIAATPAGLGWVDDAGKPLPREYAYGMRTQPAVAGKIQVGRPLLVTCHDRWYLIGPRSVDEQTGTVQLRMGGNEVCPEYVAVADVRVIVEFKFQ